MRVTFKGFWPESTMRHKVERLETVVEQLPQVHCPVREFFADGVYAREMTIPEGVVATGAVHKGEHMSIVTRGKCLLTTEEGVSELTAGCISVTKPGMKRAIVALEETVLVTIHPNPTNESDPAKLVEMLTESKASELLGGPDNRQLQLEAQ